MLSIGGKNSLCHRRMSQNLIELLLFAPLVRLIFSMGIIGLKCELVRWNGFFFCIKKKLFVFLHFHSDFGMVMEYPVIFLAAFLLLSIWDRLAFSTGVEFFVHLAFGVSRGYLYNFTRRIDGCYHNA